MGFMVYWVCLFVVECGGVVGFGGGVFLVGVGIVLVVVYVLGL